MMPPLEELLVASKNPDKLAELTALLRDLPVRVRSARELPDLPDVEEDEPTFDGNAVKKALSAARFAGTLAVADDSGLEVDALGGEPGVRSARYAGATKGNYAANNEKLLAALAGVPPPRRTARFRCAMACARPSGVIFTTAGAIHGRILEGPRGSGGFGYDPLFLPDGETATFAELSAARKNEISHRAHAARAFREELARHLGAAAEQTLPSPGPAGDSGGCPASRRAPREADP